MSQATQTSAFNLPRDDEQELLQGLLADDTRAWRRFNELYARLIYRCITRVTARFSAVVSQDDVDEIYANLCLQLLSKDKRKLRSYDPDRGTKLSSWIGLLATNVAYDFLRGKKRSPRTDDGKCPETLRSQNPDPYETCLEHERAEILTRVMQTFSEKDQRFVELYYGQGLEPEHIARELGISVKTVYSKKHKIRGRLVGLLEKRQLAA